MQLLAQLVFLQDWYYRRIIETIWNNAAETSTFWQFGPKEPWKFWVSFILRCTIYAAWVSIYAALSYWILLTALSASPTALPWAKGISRSCVYACIFSNWDKIPSFRRVLWTLVVTSTFNSCRRLVYSFNQFLQFENHLFLFGDSKIDAIFDKRCNWPKRTMFLLFVVTIPWAKLKLVCPTIQIYKTRCVVFSLLCYNISFTQHSNQDLFSVCQNVSTATHTFIKTEWSNFIKFAITISPKVACITNQCRSCFT